MHNATIHFWVMDGSTTSETLFQTNTAPGRTLEWCTAYSQRTAKHCSMPFVVVVPRYRKNTPPIPNNFGQALQNIAVLR